MKTPKHPKAARRRGFAGLTWKTDPERWQRHVDGLGPPPVQDAAEPAPVPAPREDVGEVEP